MISVGSGGAAEMMADLCELHHVKLGDFSPEVKAKLPEILTPFSILVNPIDIAGMTSDLNEEHLLCRKLMEFLIPQPTIGIFSIIIPFLPYMKQLAQHVVELSATTTKPIIPIMTGGGEYPACAELFRKNRIPFFATADQGARGLRVLQERTAFAARQRTRHTGPAPASGARESARKILEQARASGQSTLTLLQAGPLLSAYGLRLPAQVLVRSAAEARSALVHLGGPVVMKIESSKILHKTEIGGVRLGVGSADIAEQAYAELLKAGRAAASEKDIDGVLMQRMIPFHTEIILGSTRDSALGHVVLVGLGGVWVELLRDVALRLAPIGLDEAKAMLAETKAAKLLAGYRGKPPADVDALISSIVSFSALVSDLDDLVQEIEINPIFVMENGQGALVGDALIKL
jgi:acetate---CoA ligase (ADP-forming)